MRITYTLCREDMVVLNDYLAKAIRERARKPLPKVVLWCLIYGGGAAWWLYAGGSEAFREQLMLVVTGVEVPLLAIYVIYQWFQPWGKMNFERLEQENPTLYEPRTLELTPEHYVATDGTGSGTTRWTAVKEIVRHPDRIFFTLEGGATFAVPRRAFASPEEADRFTDTAAQYQREADAAKGEAP